MVRLLPVAAIVVLVAGVLTAVTVGAPAHRDGGWAPWWLIPVAFILLRRVAWSRPGRASDATVRQVLPGNGLPAL